MEENKSQEAPKEEKSIEQLRKERLNNELLAKKLLYSGINQPYIAQERDEKGHATDITPEKPYSHSNLNSRQMRRGNERVSFSIFQDRIQTSFERRTSSGLMLKKYTKKEGLQNDVKVPNWIKA